MDSYWTKIRRNSHYQQEEVLDWAIYLEHLQAVLKEFNPTGISNKTTLIRYFREGLYLSIQAHLNYQRWDLDSSEEVMEKVDNAEAKANLQPPFYVKDIDTRCLKGHRLSAKKNEDDTYQKPQNKASKDKNKVKSHSSPTSANHPQT